MGLMRKTRSGRDATGWGEVVEAPRLDVPDERRTVVKRRLLTAVVWCALLALPVQTLAIASLVSRDPVVAAPSAADASSFSLSKLVAGQEVSRWLGSQPAPLPGGHVVSVDEIQHLSYPAPKGSTADKPTFSVDVVTFTLIDGAQRGYKASVQVAVDPRGSAKAMGGPSLQPVAQAANDSWDEGGPWPGLESADIPDAAEKAVTGWATAYASGDPDALRLAVGDTSSSSYYAPLRGTTGATAAVVAATALGGDRLAARVTLDISWQGAARDVAGSQTGAGDSDRPLTTMDVLIERAGTAAPIVTAWGPAGTGPSLKRYSNAVAAAGRPVEQTPAPSTTGAPTATQTTAAVPPQND